MVRKHLIVASLLLMVGSVSQAHASGHWGHHGGAHFGLSFGDPFFWGPSYYQPYYAPNYYSPPTVIIEREPPVYVQRAPAPPTQVAQLWYYCPSPAGYYPHVPNCTQPWVPVDPSSVPPGPRR
jgi:hypothetical protein